MLEVIQELMPLLQGASDGAFWLVLGYFALVLVKMLLITGVAGAVIHYGYKLVVYLNHGIEDLDIRRLHGMYRHKHFIGGQHRLSDLLIQCSKARGPDTSYITEEDVLEAIKVLKENQKETEQ